MKRLHSIFIGLFAIAVLSSVAFPVFSQNRDLLTPEEILWLSSRNNTIVVYPEKNDPPFSYTSAGGSIQGLSIDYIELIAEKVGAKLQYLAPQARNQILSEFQSGKGDVIPGLTQTEEKNLTYLFSDSYINVPTVIVVRKDFEKRKALTLNDFSGKRVSVVAGSSLEAYVKENYPRVIIEDVTDDEVSLQQIVLGEVEAGVMDVASLSYFLSKQVLNSVKVVGNTGFEYKPALAVSKEDPILQDILDKGLSQISTREREILNEKWVVVPGETEKDNSLLAHIEQNFSIEALYIIFGIVIVLVIVYMLRYSRMGGERGSSVVLEHEVKELEEVNKKLIEELKEIKEEEHKMEEKLDTLSKKP